MNAPDRPPLPDRDLPTERRAAIRTMLVDYAHPAGAGKRAPMTRRRVLVVAASLLAVVLVAAQLWPRPDGRELVEAWTPSPQRVDAAMAAAVAEECESWYQPPAGDPGSGWDPVVVDRRGDLAVGLLVTAAEFRTCVFHGIGRWGTEGLRHLGGAGGGSGYVQLGELAALTLESSGQAQFPPYDVGIGQLLGQAAPQVARVVVTLQDGTEIEASVSGGWYLAWWPGTAYRILLWSHISTPRPVTITAYDDSGVELDRIEPPASPW